MIYIYIYYIYSLFSFAYSNESFNILYVCDLRSEHKNLIDFTWKVYSSHPHYALLPHTNAYRSHDGLLPNGLIY